MKGRGEKEDEEEDPLAKLDMSLIERQKVHDAGGVGKKEDDFDADASEGTLGSGAEVETHREGNVASPRASSKRLFRDAAHPLALAISGNDFL